MPQVQIGLSLSLAISVAIVLLTLEGCGPSQEVLDRQEAQLKEAIQEAKSDPPNMSPEEKEMRRHRLEMDYGEVAPKSE